jgi:hypothetical protein
VYNLNYTPDNFCGYKVEDKLHLWGARTKKKPKATRLDHRCEVLVSLAILPAVVNLNLFLGPTFQAAHTTPPLIVNLNFSTRARELHGIIAVLKQSINITDGNGCAMLFNMYNEMYSCSDLYLFQCAWQCAAGYFGQYRY